MLLSHFYVYSNNVEEQSINDQNVSTGGYLFEDCTLFTFSDEIKQGRYPLNHITSSSNFLRRSLAEWSHILTYFYCPLLITLQEV